MQTRCRPATAPDCTVDEGGQRGALAARRQARLVRLEKETKKKKKMEKISVSAKISRTNFKIDLQGAESIGFATQFI